jgi:LysR family glycine cleavage system transcriptional activator
MKARKSLPSLKSLRAFQIAGRHLSFKDAADELFLTASAVSHQVKNLEEYLGIDLFLRKTRALELTDPGKKYFMFLDEMFARLESETHQMWAEYGRKVIRLCVPPFFASELLLPKLSEFKSLMPDSDIRVTTQPSLMKVHPPDADLSILLGTGDWPGLESIPLFPRRVMTACSPELKEKFRFSSFSDLDGRTLIVHENRPQSWENWAKALKIRPPNPGKVYRFDSMAAVVQAAVEGHGVALVSWPLSESKFKSGALVRALDDEVKTGEKFYVAHRVEEQEREDVANLIDWIVEEFQSDE